MACDGQRLHGCIVQQCLAFTIGLPWLWDSRNELDYRDEDFVGEPEDKCFSPGQDIFATIDYSQDILCRDSKVSLAVCNESHPMWSHSHKNGVRSTSSVKPGNKDKSLIGGELSVQALSRKW